MNSLHQAVASAQGVVFDLFHTLTARESTWSANPMTHAMLGVPREAWEQQLFETSRFRLTGAERDPQKIIERLALAINPDLDAEILRRAADNRLDRFAKSLVNIPAENLAVLARLRRSGAKLGLVSNADAGEIQAWGRSPLREHFDSVVISCEVGLVKPEPEIYLHCLRELGLAPAHCIFVGDGGSGELTAARQLGFTTVMIAGVIRELWPDKIPDRAREAHFAIEELSELLPDAK
jgi:putative hydrolase of the HAD superfamily